MTHVVLGQLGATAEELRRWASPEGVKALEDAAGLIAGSVLKGGKLLICGNGGSAADCQHLAAEFTCRLSAARPRGPIPALALTTDTSFITACSNDYSFEMVFARQVRALGRPGDVLMGISTSGTSRNVVSAVEEARGMGIATLALTGEGGDPGVPCGHGPAGPLRGYRGDTERAYLSGARYLLHGGGSSDPRGIFR